MRINIFDRFWFSISIFTVLVLMSSNLQAYIVAIDPVTPSKAVMADLYIAGFGANQGDQFLKAARTAALVSRDRFKKRTRVIISAVSEELPHDAGLLKKAGFKLLRADNADLSGNAIIETLEQIGIYKYSSMHFFAHANAFNGLRLEGKFLRFNHEDQSFAALGRFLTPESIVVFNTCNSGWLLAPTGARLWNVPVFGAMGGSNFQQIYSDLKWHYNDPRSVPENLKPIGPTTLFTHTEMDCSAGRCLRLHPVNVQYNDEFGEFERGLGFYKVFATPTAASKVPKALIHYTYLLPGIKPLTRDSSASDIVAAASDWMCPADKAGVLRTKCFEAIENEHWKQDPYLSFFKGKPVACDQLNCQTVIKCNTFKAVFGAVPCHSENLSNAKSDLFSTQVSQIFEGIQQYKSGQFRLPYQ